jgi:hypothetical protein
MRFIEMRLRDKIISLRGQKMNEVWDKSMLQVKICWVNEIVWLNDVFIGS